MISSQREFENLLGQLQDVQARRQQIERLRSEYVASLKDPDSGARKRDQLLAEAQEAQIEIFGDLPTIDLLTLEAAERLAEKWKTLSLPSPETLAKIREERPDELERTIGLLHDARDRAYRARSEATEAGRQTDQAQVELEQKLATMKQKQQEMEDQARKTELALEQKQQKMEDQARKTELALKRARVLDLLAEFEGLGATAEYSQRASNVLEAAADKISELQSAGVIVTDLQETWRADDADLNRWRLFWQEQQALKGQDHTNNTLQLMERLDQTSPTNWSSSDRSDVVTILGTAPVLPRPLARLLAAARRDGQQPAAAITPAVSTLAKASETWWVEWDRLANPKVVVGNTFGSKNDAIKKLSENVKNHERNVALVGTDKELWLAWHRRVTQAVALASALEPFQPVLTPPQPAAAPPDQGSSRWLPFRGAPKPATTQIPTQTAATPTWEPTTLPEPTTEFLEASFRRLGELLEWTADEVFCLYADEWLLAYRQLFNFLVDQTAQNLLLGTHQRALDKQKRGREIVQRMASAMAAPPAS